MALYQDKKTKKWCYRLSSYDETGKRSQKHSKWYDLKKEAKEAEKEYLKSINENNSSDEEITFKDVWESYVDFKKDKLKITSYNAILNKGIHYESLYSIKMIDFDITVFNKWKKYINKQDFSTTHKNNLYKCLRSILRYSEKYLDIKVNTLLNKMTNFNNPNELKKEMNFFTYDEFKSFINVEEDLTYKTFFEVLYYCGLRQGEIQALTWKDITFVNDNEVLVKINKTLTSKIKGKKYVILPPKTKSSYRTLPVKNRQLISDLKLLKERCQKLYGFSEEWFVFGNVYPLADTTIQTRKNKNCKSAGVKRIRIHDFRHSCASLLINKGASVALVSKYLGHSDIATTLNIYSHMFKSELQDIAEELKDL